MPEMRRGQRHAHKSNLRRANKRNTPTHCGDCMYGCTSAQKKHVIETCEWDCMNAQVHKLSQCQFMKAKQININHATPITTSNSCQPIVNNMPWTINQACHEQAFNNNMPCSHQCHVTTSHSTPFFSLLNCQHQPMWMASHYRSSWQSLLASLLGARMLLGAPDQQSVPGSSTRVIVAGTIRKPRHCMLKLLRPQNSFSGCTGHQVLTETYYSLNLASTHNQTSKVFQQ